MDAREGGQPAGGRAGRQHALALLIYAARVVADELTPFLPEAAVRVAAQLGGGQDELGAPQPLFPRIEAKDS